MVALSSVAAMSEAQVPSTQALGTQPSPSTQPAAPDHIEQAPDAVKQSASIMRQIGQGFVMYANEKKGQTPPDLQAMSAMFKDGFIENLQNPRTGAKPGYEYVSPGPKVQKIRNSHQVPMLWELDKDGKRLPGGLVLYVDGHVAAEPAKP